MRKIGQLAMVISILTACNLNAPATEIPANTPLPTDQPTQAAAAATTTPLPTDTAEPTATSNPGGCNIPVGWVEHNVARGETLSIIARRVHSTVTELIQANCISTPNIIRVGQIIYVPKNIDKTLVGTSRPPLSQSPPDEVGTVSVSSSISGDSGNFVLLHDSVITLTWEDGPKDAEYVVFWLFPPGWTLDRAGTDNPPLGRDEDGSDGWSIDWTVEPGILGELVVFGYQENEALLAVNLFTPSISTSKPGCELTVVGPESIPLRRAPTMSSSVDGELAPGDYMPYVGRNLSGWYALDPTGTGGVSRLRWLIINAEVETRGNCE